ncbi:MAG: AI-2E family transporter [bacterium]|nr:AI-2E family transporter [bacterium]
MNGSPPALSSSRWGARTKQVVVLIGLVCIGFAALNLLEIFPIIILSTLLSYLLWPQVLLIERRVLPPRFKSRTLAVVLTFVTVIAIFVFALLIIVPTLVREVADVAQALPATISGIEGQLETVLSRPLRLFGRTVMMDGEPFVPLEQIRALTGTEEGGSLVQTENIDVLGTVRGLLGSVGTLTGPAFGVLGGFFNAVFNLTFLVVIMFYLLRDGDRFTGQLVSATPLPYRGDMARMLYEMGRVWNAYFRGQLILCSTIGLLVYIAATLLGVPNAPILGLMAGILEFIPNIGPFIALVPAFFLALFSQSSTLPFLEGLPFALTVAVTWTLIQNLESIYVVPRVMGGNLDLHPVVVILAVIAGASIAGTLGIILAAPFAATLRLVGLYIYGKLFDIDPFVTPKQVPKPTTAEPNRMQQWASQIATQFQTVTRQQAPLIAVSAWRRVPAVWRSRITSIQARVLPARAGQVISEPTFPSEKLNQTPEEGAP